MSQEKEQLLTPSQMENARRNIWIYRAYQGLSRRNMISGPVKAGTIRNYEHGFAPIFAPHLTIIAARLGVKVDDLLAPPDFTLVFDWQTRRLIEAMRKLNQHQRHEILRLARIMRAK